MAPVIPPKRNRRPLADYDAEIYKWRHLVENFFADLKDNRGIATRYCKTDASFSSFIAIAATVLWLTSTDPSKTLIVKIWWLA